MDELALASGKPTDRDLVGAGLEAPDLESQTSLARLKGANTAAGPEDVISKDHARGTEAESGVVPEIRKTVEIRQHSSTGA